MATKTVKTVIDGNLAREIASADDSARMKTIKAEYESVINSFKSEAEELRKKFDLAIDIMHSQGKCMDVSPIRKPREKEDANADPFAKLG